ncbi:unnamed protein product [Adineta steineri]|uniref:RING-type domain-containing protein n=1 Tax=Adineta steineri TaxID=433720 RepID=A0A814HPB4_9BILA|nr:unnamed protein product [Adineta steineri]CAF1374342.1 unnamed protein product [Adineta steineri]CAF1605103.1 unnamed protein product [Adineta steineri]CAF1605361.1 unnamed protein product [Adineta steineri]
MDEGNIDRGRIVNSELVPEEYFCPICQDLLWKPRSCASCQHLFCEKCLRMWSENPVNREKCPFRCQPFEERRCPPYVQSLLSRLNIHCRNASFGCTAILSYDKLELHEKSQCQYLTQRCSDCDQLVLLSKFNEHQQTTELCVPQPIKCTICQTYFPKALLQNHFYQCCEMKINNLIERTNADQTLQLTADGQQIPMNPGLAFIQSIVTSIQLVEQQKKFSQLPTSLKGTDPIRRAQEQRRNPFYRLLLMLKFLVLNWSKAPFFMWTFTVSTFMIFAMFAFGCFIILSNWSYRRLHFGIFLLSLFSYFLSYGTYFLLQTISDTNIIFYVGLCMFLCGCMMKISLEVMEMSPLMNKPIICIICCCIGILLMKIILLLIRFYYWLMPIYLAATIFTLLHCFLACTFYRVAVPIAAQTPPANQPTMPV